MNYLYNGVELTEPSKWETVFDGYVYPEVYSTNGYHGVIYVYDDTPSRFNDGDTVRITLDGKVIYDTMQKEGYYAIPFCGNEWLGAPKTNVECIDDGTDFYMSEYNDALHGYFRDFGTHQLKLERESDVDKPITMDEPHLYNGYKLPKLPERDKSAYPYAMIYIDSFWPVCVFSSVPLTYNWDDYETNPAPFAQVLEFTYRGETGAVDTTGETGEAWDVTYNNLKLGEILWSDYDVLYENGSPYFAASDPIPVGSSDLKPIYKRINGQWVKQTAYERQNGQWVQISSA